MPTTILPSRPQGKSAERIADLEALLAQMSEALRESAILLSWASVDILGEVDKARAAVLAAENSELCGRAQYLLGQTR